jgi:hypothetical protein
MAGDPFRKPLRGEPFEPNARLQSALIDLLKRKPKGGAADAKPEPIHTDVVKVRNNSGAAVDRFGVLGLDEPIFLPVSNAASLKELKRERQFTGVTPVAGSHRGRFAILAEPVKAGGVARAVVSGAYIAQVSVTDAAHQFADVKDGDATQLASDWGGSCRILWKDSGTGTKWAVLLLGSADPGSGQYQGQNLTTVTQNTRGWDFQRAYVLPE